MVIVFSPPASKDALMETAALLPRFMIATTDATPMTMPRRERNVLILLEAIDLSAILMFSETIILYPPISYGDDTRTFRRKRSVMCNKYNRTAFLVETMKEIHDLMTS